jgi:hypothetical protein
MDRNDPLWAARPPDLDGAEAPSPSLTEETLGRVVTTLADRLAAIEADMVGRFDAMRSAFLELKNRRSDASPTDDPHRRLVNCVGYTPTLQQQIELFAALAKWQATSPSLHENKCADYKTKKGATVRFGWADLAQIIAVAQTAAPFGLVALTRQEFDDQGHPVITGYLVHVNGGAICSGPVPLYVEEETDRRGQAHSGGLTTARRLALQMVLGLAAQEVEQPQKAVRQTPETSLRRAEGGPGRLQGPPPGWLNKAERMGLERELSDPSTTPARRAEVESRLQAAAAAGTSSGVRA